MKVRDKSDLSHEVHADNCTVKGSTCDPSPPAYRLQNKDLQRKIFQPWQIQLPVSLRPPLPQLPAQTVQRRPLLFRRTSYRRTSVHSDVVCRASMWTTLGVHLWRRELARSDACCRWHQVMFSSLNKNKSLKFKNQCGFVFGQKIDQFRCALGLWFSHDANFWEPEIGLAWDLVRRLSTICGPIVRFGTPINFWFTLPGGLNKSWTHTASFAEDTT